MSFYQRYKSPKFTAVVRQYGSSGPIVGRTVEVEIDFVCDVVNELGLVMPYEAPGKIDDMMRELFEDKLLIDNSDPHADDLVKLKRLGLAAPVLFDHGTTGPQVCFFIGRKVEDWLDRQKWNPGDREDPTRVRVALAVIRLGSDEFFYDIA